MNLPFPEPREIPALFGDPSYSFSGLSSGATARVTDDELELRFEYDETLIADVKLFRRAHWSPDTKSWLLTVTREQCPMLVEVMKREGFSFGQDVIGLLRANWPVDRSERT